VTLQSQRTQPRRPTITADVKKTSTLEMNVVSAPVVVVAWVVVVVVDTVVSVTNNTMSLHDRKES